MVILTGEVKKCPECGGSLFERFVDDNGSHWICHDCQYERL